MSTHDSDQDELSEGRRELLKAIAAASGMIATRVLLPLAWSAPVVASMPLPAHAALSYGGSISATVSDGIVKLTIAPSDSVRSERVQFQVYETANGDEHVVGLMAPSAASDLSGGYTVELPRAAGTYKYELRWINGHSSSITVTVKGS